MPFSKSARRGGFAGFTLVELLVVIIIILMLVGILLPALSAARARARKTASQMQLRGISQACESYQLALGAYPGFFSQFYETQSPRYLLCMTDTENLTLSLMGGIVNDYTSTLYPTGPDTIRHNYLGLRFSSGTYAIYVPNIGQGPRSASGEVYAPFYSAKPNELAKIQGVNFNGYPNLGDSIPELIDPISNMPLLYYRAIDAANYPVVYQQCDPLSADPVTGTASVTSNGVKQGYYGTANNEMYTRCTALKHPEGTVRNQTTSSLLNRSDASQTTDMSARTLSWLVTDPRLSIVASNNTSPDAANNPASSPATQDVIKGKYLLLAPGPDGIYMGRDDRDSLGALTPITKYSELDSFDDVWLNGG